MLKSMTGFGRSEIANERQKITVEMKAVSYTHLLPPPAAVPG